MAEQEALSVKESAVWGLILVHKALGGSLLLNSHKIHSQRCEDWSHTRSILDLAPVGAERSPDTHLT